jgi:single-strand DNA-binding protein
MEHIEHINKIELQGRVGTVRANEHNGSKVVNFTMVTDYLYKTRDGAAVNEGTWHNIVAWEGSQITDLDKIVKGAPVNVTGRLRVSRYTSADGVEKQYYEVMANKICFLRE